MRFFWGGGKSIVFPLMSMQLKLPSFVKRFLRNYLGWENALAFRLSLQETMEFVVGFTAFSVYDRSRGKTGVEKLISVWHSICQIIRIISSSLSMRKEHLRVYLLYKHLIKLTPLGEGVPAAVDGNKMDFNYTINCKDYIYAN